jgi:hypothetical protein
MIKRATQQSYVHQEIKEDIKLIMLAGSKNKNDVNCYMELWRNVIWGNGAEKLG